MTIVSSIGIEHNHSSRTLEVRMNRVAKSSFVVACACVGLVSFAGGAAADPDAKEVNLTAVADGAGGCTITVDPETAIISRGPNAKIKKVYWVTEPNPELGELYWELRYDPGKGGGSENYFGDVDLACGESSIKVQPSPKPSIPNAEWPYMVTVYRCADGAKSEYLCTVDPRIRWDD
jgi:hypothetical protein